MALTRKSRTAMDIFKSNVGCISTYSKKIDDMLGRDTNYHCFVLNYSLIDGGIRLGVMTELCGNPGSGKSNLWFVRSIELLISISILCILVLNYVFPFK